MKATGMVRRIDDIGRIVIPKSVRRTLGICEGAPMELFIEDDGTIAFKKYDVVPNIQEALREFESAVIESLDCDTKLDSEKILQKISEIKDLLKDGKLK